jgi:hypothetical protein
LGGLQGNYSRYHILWCVRVSSVAPGAPGVVDRSTSWASVADGRDGEISRGRMERMRTSYASKAALSGFVTDSVKPGATLRTDGWPSYTGLEALGYTHDPFNLSASG